MINMVVDHATQFGAFATYALVHGIIENQSTFMFIIRLGLDVQNQISGDLKLQTLPIGFWQTVEPVECILLVITINVSVLNI